MKNRKKTARKRAAEDIMQEVKVLETAPVIVVALSGEIAAENADEFYTEFKTVYEAQPSDVTFDCAQLSFIDSTTLGTFVKILKRVREDGHNLKLIHLQPRLKKLFVICALDTIMEIEG